MIWLHGGQQNSSMPFSLTDLGSTWDSLMGREGTWGGCLACDWGLLDGQGAFTY